MKIGQPKLSEEKSQRDGLVFRPTNLGSKMSLVVNDYWYKWAILGAGSPPLKFTLVTHSKVFVIQPDHRA